MEIASIVASFVSLIIGILAGWLSIHFYNKQKDDASRVEVALASIREQTNALQAVSATLVLSTTAKKYRSFRRLPLVQTAAPRAR